MNPWVLGYNLVFSVVAPIYIKWDSRHLIGTPELNKKYHSFYRYDMPEWDLLTGIIFNFVSFYPLRLLSAGLAVIVICLICMACLIGHESGTAVPKWRVKTCRFLIVPLLRFLNFTMGMVWINLRRIDVDWRKYLGPDWKPSYEGAGIQVANH